MAHAGGGGGCDGDGTPVNSPPLLSRPELVTSDWYSRHWFDVRIVIIHSGYEDLEEDPEDPSVAYGFAREKRQD